MVDTMQPPCLLVSESRRHLYGKRMNLRKMEKREPLAPLRSLVGRKLPAFQSRAKCFS